MAWVFLPDQLLDAKKRQWEKSLDFDEMEPEILEDISVEGKADGTDHSDSRRKGELTEIPVEEHSS